MCDRHGDPEISLRRSGETRLETASLEPENPRGMFGKSAVVEELQPERAKTQIEQKPPGSDIANWGAERQRAPETPPQGQIAIVRVQAVRRDPLAAIASGSEGNRDSAGRVSERARSRVSCRS